MKFMAWLENPKTKEVRFMTKQLLASEEGRNLRRYVNVTKAITPEVCVTDHGATEFVYDMKPYAWTHKECTDFSTPTNFPKEVAEAIKENRVATEGVEVPEGLMNPEVKFYTPEEGWKKFESRENRAPAWQ